MTIIRNQTRNDGLSQTDVKAVLGWARIFSETSEVLTV